MSPLPRLALAALLAGGACSREAPSPAGPRLATSDTELPPGFCQSRHGGALPVLLLTTNKHRVPDKPKIKGQLQVLACRATPQGVAPVSELRAGLGIEERGSSSRDTDKRSYDIELRDEVGRAAPQELLGMKGASDWVLHACYYDKTCMRNAAGYAMARQLGRWAPDTRFVELYLNGRYKGLYLVVEKITRSKSRLNLPRPAGAEQEGDLSGGYIIRREGGGRGQGKDWKAASGANWSFHYPRPDKLTPSQKAFLAQKIDRFEKVLAGPDWADATGGYPAMVDVASWVDFAIMQELSNNPDAYYRSVYLQIHPERAGGRLVAGPVWDFDLSFGNADFRESWRTDIWSYEANARTENLKPVPGYWERIWCDPPFRRAAAQRWTALRQSRFTDRWFEQLIAGFQQQIADARERDDELWVTIGTAGWPSHFVGQTFEQEVAWLDNWIKQRTRWLDQNLGPASECSRRQSRKNAREIKQDLRQR